MQPQLKENQLVVISPNCGAQPHGEAGKLTIRKSEGVGYTLEFWGNINTFKGEITVWVLRRKGSKKINAIDLRYPIPQSNGQKPNYYFCRDLLIDTPILMRHQKMMVHYGLMDIIAPVSTPISAYLVQHFYHSGQFDPHMNTVFSKGIEEIDRFLSDIELDVEYAAATEWWSHINMEDISRERKNTVNAGQPGVGG